MTHRSTKHVISPGDRYGRLVVIETGLKVPNSSGYFDRAALCRCDCGAEKVARVQNLVKGLTKSCNCLRRETSSANGTNSASHAVKNIINLGQKFGRLSVVETGVVTGWRNGERGVRVECSCGNQKVVRRSNLVHGTTASCGCLKRESARENQARLAAAAKEREPIVAPTIPGVPTVRAVLEALAGAGEKGLLAAEICRMFSEPRDRGARNRGVNSILAQLQARGGRAARSEALEASPWYLGTPTLRWFITPEGAAFLSRGPSAAKLKQAKKQAAMQRREAALAWAREQGLSPHSPQDARDLAIVELTSAGVSSYEIGAVFGLTGARVRQIFLGPDARKPKNHCRTCSCLDEEEIAAA